MRSKFVTYYKILIHLILLAIIGLIVLFAYQVFTDENLSNQRASNLGLHPDRFYQHTPEMSWAKDQARLEGIMTSHDKRIIEDTYKKAWFCLNNVVANQNSLCLHEYFGDELREKIINGFDPELESQQVDLSHQLQFNQVTLDRQVISISDLNVEILENNKVKGQWVKTKSKKSIDLMMQLQDDRWKITDWVELRNETTEVADSNLVINKDLQRLSEMKGVNYYPSEFPWRKFWLNFDSPTIAEDFKNAKASSFNTIRVFIPYEIFGGGHPDELRMNELKDLLNLAHEESLNVIVTLFDFPVGFDLLHYPAYQKHLRTILNRFKDHPAVLSWCLKNEPDIDYEYHDPQLVNDWLQFILNEAKEIAPESIFTIGWAYPESASYLSEKVDYVSFHYYRDADQFEKDIKELKASVEDKLIILEEFGKSSYSSFWFPFSSSEKLQAHYLFEIYQLAEENDIPTVLWCLNDFQAAPSDVFGWKPWIKKPQTQFGVYDIEGQLKLKNIGESQDLPKLTWKDHFQIAWIFYLILFALFIFILRKIVIRKLI